MTLLELRLNAAVFVTPIFVHLSALCAVTIEVQHTMAE